MSNEPASRVVQLASEKNRIPVAGTEARLTVVTVAGLVARAIESRRSSVNAWQNPASTVGAAVVKASAVAFAGPIVASCVPPISVPDEARMFSVAVGF